MPYLHLICPITNQLHVIHHGDRQDNKNLHGSEVGTSCYRTAIFAAD